MSRFYCLSISLIGSKLCFFLLIATFWASPIFFVSYFKPRGTATRAPGTTQGHAIIENLMEHMASKLGEDPIEFRLKNMLKEGDY